MPVTTIGLTSDPQPEITPSPYDPLAPAPVEEEEPVRKYVILEEVQTADLLANAIEYIRSSGVHPLVTASDLAAALADHFQMCVTYEPLGIREARNGPHARRQVARERLGDAGGSLVLCAVAEKMWKPRRVSSSVTYSVD